MRWRYAWPRAASHGRLVLIAGLLAGLACHPPDRRIQVAGLDGRLLAALEDVLAPVPQFSGPPLLGLRFRPQTGSPCPPALGYQDAPRRGGPQRNRLARLGRELAHFAAEHGNTPHVLRMQALWTLLSIPTPEGRERTVRLLEESLAREPASMARRNDLAAAHLVRASLDGQVAEYAVALELLDTAAAEPTQAVLANRTYALQCLTLWDDAELVWQQLSWAARQGADKRQRVAAATAVSASSSSPGGAADDDPVARRRRGEWLLGEWGKQLLQGHSAAARELLREAEAIGTEIQTRRGDSLLRASVAVIRQAETSRKRFELDALMRGHAAFHSVRGDAIYAECRPATLRFAERQLDRAGSPFAGFVRLDRAVCVYFANEFSRAEALFDELRQDARRRGEPAVEARCEWLLGLIGVVQARFAEANRHYARAIELFSRLGEDAHVVYLRSLRARSFEYGGARREAWSERLPPLSGRQAIRDPTRLFVILDEAVSALQDQGYRVAALSFLSAQMRVAEAAARQSGKTDLLVFSLLARAALLSETGRDDAAARDVDAAEKAWARLSSFNESRSRLRVEIDLRRTLVDRRLGSERDLAAVDRAIAFFARSASSLGGQLQILKLDQLRARIDSRRGDFRAARADLLRGAAEVERQRLETATIEERARILAQAREIFSELVRLDLDEFHDPMAALDAVERSSNRVLLDAARDRVGEAVAGPVLRLEALRRLLPPGTIVVRYGHLADRILLWTVDDGRLSFEQRLLPAEDLRQQVEQCREILASGGAGTAREAHCDALAQTLLPKHLLNLAAGAQPRPVLFVPDEIVAPLPLGALRIAPGGPYLLQAARVAYAPSLTLLLAGSRALRRDGDSPPHSALFVSDPAFSREIFPSLGRLPAARRAVSHYASHYPLNEILTDQAATVPAVLAALDRFELLHFDGHGLSNAQYPERGGLLLTPTGPRRVELGSAMLTASNLRLHSHSHLRLVILGACSTGLATYRDTAEVTGLAAAFLAQGVPEVVAAAWDVPDDDAAELLERFHRSLAAGSPTVAALQTAQIEFLLSHRPAATAWAAFQLFARAENPPQVRLK